MSDAIRDCKQLLNIIFTYSRNKSAKVYLHAMRALQSLLLRLVGRDNNPPKKEELNALVDVIKELENYQSISDEEKIRNEIIGEEIKILVSLFYRERVEW
ncbi:MAG: hypothetical protein J1E64_09640 [Acetatifactor sp.]|nr:hypothetical protein [Acetatifactor sp.]